MFLRDLPESDQEFLRRCVKLLRHCLRVAESRLRNYESETTTDGVTKMIEDLKTAHALARNMINELVAKHGLPPEFAQALDIDQMNFQSIFKQDG